MRIFSTLPLLALLATLPAVASAQTARKVHDDAIVLDTHFDTPANLGRPGWTITDRHDTARDGDQVDVPRMIEGGVDGGFFAIYTAQGPRTPEARRAARDAGFVRAVQIREMVARHPNVFQFVTTAEQARAVAASGKRFVFMSMENGTPVEADVSLLSTFHALGLTMASPVHFKNNDLADSATDKPEWNGLSPAGRAFVAEANRLGILLDASHASDQVLEQMIALSKAPIILSHSGVRAIYNHPRNVSDADLKLLAAKGGVVQINAFSAYMIDQPKIPERDAAMQALMAKAGNMRDMTPAQRSALMTERKAIDARWPAPRATFADLMKHLEHAIQVAGIDHVGLSGDFDGGGGIEGFDGVADFPKVSAVLLERGYSAADVAKVMGGNALRVLAAAQAAGDPAARVTIPQTN
ncbi:dipeptidase [Sphingomonas hengshuiensis]|uniref:Peptidase M19 n=1 Tax=Sphingomonas hengshuiensis TaxID=1609977 RepID=A0A7U5BEE0_9SPHN|nr:dipeptidase [Sphingomonas hengshuiensis]AJP70693.1 peptidase M19 [Sphingomonas hengshuiensis]